MDSHPVLRESGYPPYRYDSHDDVIRDEGGDKTFDCHPAMTNESVYAVHAMNSYPKLVRLVKWMRGFAGVHRLCGPEIDTLLRDIEEL